MPAKLPKEGTNMNIEQNAELIATMRVDRAIPVLDEGYYSRFKCSDPSDQLRGYADYKRPNWRAECIADVAEYLRGER